MTQDRVDPIHKIVGIWRSVASNIPNYTPGREWFSFNRSGSHLWVIKHEGCETGAREVPFRLEQRGPGLFRLFVEDKGRGLGEYRAWNLEIRMISPSEIEVVAPHAYKTIFRRTD